MLRAELKKLTNFAKNCCIISNNMLFQQYNICFFYKFSLVPRCTMMYTKSLGGFSVCAEIFAFLKGVDL